jgi:hypothetical protein
VIALGAGNINRVLESVRRHLAARGADPGEGSA